VLWIGIVLNADPDTNPTFHLAADPDPDLTPSYRKVKKSYIFVYVYSL
jgi:hypothetical protein